MSYAWAMRRWRFRIVYFVLLPALAVAAAILGYYTWRTAAQFARLGEETIVQSTLLLVREKVDRIERMIINADNAVFELVDLDTPAAIQVQWPSLAPSVSPSVRSVVVLDDSGTIIVDAARGSAQERRQFLKVLLERMMPDLELEKQPLGRLKHLHRTYAGTSYLVSYKALSHRGRRYYAIAYHDTEHIIRHELPQLFATEEGKRLYNVLDDNNRRIYGPSLARAGDYLVGHRFPTTLYGWRLQVAPKQAPLLDAKGRSQRVNEVALLGTSFVIILLGVAFLIYAADKERRLNALKSEFIANVSHELKTPLSVIRMFGELLMTGRVRSPEKQQQYLEMICRESERLTALIENVLDFSALERGKLRFELEEGDLGAVVSGAVDTFRTRLEHGDAQIHLHLEEALPQVRLDGQAIFLAVMNLLDNAVKYGAGSPIDVTVAVESDEVLVQVRDGGPGIAPEDLRRVFERFFRGRRARAARGSGIGLSIVERIAVAHGGRVFAQTGTEGGALVGFAIPAIRSPQPVGDASLQGEPAS
jgi:two-component system, OmpR family, phosphate regulon sensor histidine kinase PhoR